VTTPVATTERAVVGALLIAPAPLQDEILGLVRDTDFAYWPCRWIVQAVRAMRAADYPVDPVTVAGWVAQTGQPVELLRMRSLVTLLHELAHDVPTAAHGTWYAVQVLQESARRAAVAAAKRIIAAAQQGAFDDLSKVLYDAAMDAGEAVGRASAAGEPAVPRLRAIGS
jgi:replicative DNA helicase